MPFRPPAPPSSPPVTDAGPGRERSVADFLASLAAAPAPPAGGQGRLVFALDATMSRQPTWDAACRLQGEMFEEAARAGGLAVQLVYFRGMAECRASGWVSDAGRLGALMGRIECRSGATQIGRVLAHAANEARRGRLGALVYVGDAMEESADALAAAAGELALLGVPAFLFQEGHDPAVERAYREIARITRGAWCRFDTAAARELASLLRAVAAYAAGGMTALAAVAAREEGGARLLLRQIGGA